MRMSGSEINSGFYQLRFGEHRGCTLNQIAQTSRGLAYLVDLSIRDQRTHFLYDETRAALTAFLERDELRERVGSAKAVVKVCRDERTKRIQQDLFGPEHPAFEYGIV
jgi:predicted ABC-class ATPase